MKTCRAIAFLAAMSLFAGCDIPSQGPDFSFDTRVSTPVIFDQSFVFLGSDEGGVQALIDTTRSDYDSLFAVDSENSAVYLVHNIEAFQLEALDDIIDPIDISPQDVSVRMDDLTAQSLTTAFTRRLGTVEVAGVSMPGVAPSISDGKAYFPLSAGAFLTIPPTSLIDLSEATVESVVITGESGQINRLTFEITNLSTEPFTDGSGTPGSAPGVILETNTGEEVIRAPFDRSPAPGETAVAVVDLSGLTIPASTQFRFDVSTAVGFSPIAGDPASMQIRVDMVPVRYDGFTLTDIPESAVDVSQNGVRLSADVDFTGITTLSGAVTVRIRNTLPVSVEISSLQVLIDEGVHIYAPGHPIFTAVGRSVPAGGTIDIPVELGTTAISPSVSLDASTTASASIGPTFFQASDGLDIELIGSVDVERLYFHPDGETFSSNDTMDLDTQDVQLTSASDFIQFQAGSLELRDLLNGIDLSFNEVVLSFPDIRRAPYGPGDSLVVRFKGTTDKVEQLQFAAILRNQPARNVLIDLSGTRAYAAGNVVRYHVRAVGETTAEERLVEYTDEVSASAQATTLSVAGVSGYVDPFSASLTEDANGDGRIDPLLDSEAIINEMGGFGPLEDLDSFDLTGTELAVNITTSFTADLTIYGILIGEDDAGSRTFLQGLGDAAVAPGDSLIDSFEIGGAMPSAGQMFKIAVRTSGMAGTPATQSVILDDGNSNISALLGGLPTRMRFAGKAVVESSDGRIQIQQPTAMGVTFGVTIPLNISEGFSIEKTLSADLSSIDGLTDPEARFTAERAAVILSYSNAIPLALEARFEFVDELGVVTTVLSDDAGGPLHLDAASGGANGFATAPTAGEIVMNLDEAALRSLARSSDVRLDISFAPSDASLSRIRATDRIDLTLRGDFDVNIKVGG